MGLRDPATTRCLLGVFAQRSGYGETVTLAQVFRRPCKIGGQPDRFYVVADGDLSIAKHFARLRRDSSVS